MNKRYKQKYKIKQGDEVVVIAGADKKLDEPKKVLAVITGEKSAKVLVEGVNIMTKHMKPNAQNPQGSILKKEPPIAISNVMLWSPTEKRGVRILRERKADGTRVRISKKSKTTL